MLMDLSCEIACKVYWCGMYSKLSSMICLVLFHAVQPIGFGVSITWSNNYCITFVVMKQAFLLE